MAHALGFSAQSWPLFRNSLGQPLTPRAEGQPNEVNEDYSASYTCVSGGQSIPQDRIVANTNTVAYFAERGMSACNPFNGSSIYPPSNCVGKLITPAVVAAARGA